MISHFLEMVHTSLYASCDKLVAMTDWKSSCVTFRRKRDLDLNVVCQRSLRYTFRAALLYFSNSVIKN